MNTDGHGNNTTFGSFDVTEVQLFEFMDGRIFTSLDGILPDHKSLLEQQADGIRNYDYVGTLLRGKDWVVEPLRTLQPRSFEAFYDTVGPLSLGIKQLKESFFPKSAPGIIQVMFMGANGRVIEVFPAFQGGSYEEGDDCFGALRALPDALAKSWLWRTRGWRVPSEPYEGVLTNRRLIGHPSANWLETSSYLDTLGHGWKKRFLPRIVEIFPDILVRKKSRYDIDHYYFKCFLDTRPTGINGPEGDQFFVCTTRRDQVVYHIHKGDIEHLRVLHDPADAIDRYCAHVLRRRPGEFDFSPWSERYRP